MWCSSVESLESLPEEIYSILNDKDLQFKYKKGREVYRKEPRFYLKDSSLKCTDSVENSSGMGGCKNVLSNENFKFRTKS